MHNKMQKKKRKEKTMIKSKSFYVSVVSVLCAIAVVGITSMAINGKGENGTEEEKSYLEDDKNKVKEEKVDISGLISQEKDDVIKKDESQEVMQNQPIANDNNSKVQEKKKIEKEDTQTKAQAEKIAAKDQNDKKTSKSEETIVNNTLAFNEEKGLVWPVEGEVIMEFSENEMVYYETLGQFMRSDKILIGAAVGDNVKAGADGVVENVTTTRQTGQTVTVDIGSGYSVTYGELDNITVKKGDKVKSGQIIGTVAAPSGYYSKEGTNVYFKVEENKEPVNPMYLLK